MGVYDSPENAFEAADKKPEIGKPPPLRATAKVHVINETRGLVYGDIGFWQSIRNILLAMVTIVAIPTVPIFLYLPVQYMSWKSDVWREEKNRIQEEIDRFELAIEVQEKFDGKAKGKTLIDYQESKIKLREHMKNKPWF